MEWLSFAVPCDDDAVPEEWFHLHVKGQAVLLLPVKAPRRSEMSQSGPDP
jgi:hypothetical protein